MKTPAELAARLRKMVLAAQHHYSPTGEPLRSIVVTPEWLEDMADAANALDSDPLLTDALEVVLEPLVARCNTDANICNWDEVIDAEAALDRMYRMRSCGINKI